MTLSGSPTSLETPSPFTSLRLSKQVRVAGCKSTRNHTCCPERSVNPTIEWPAVNKVRDLVNEGVLELVKLAIGADKTHDWEISALQAFKCFQNAVIR